jgi:hypothetical protein
LQRYKKGAVEDNPRRPFGLRTEGRFLYLQSVRLTATALLRPPMIGINPQINAGLRSMAMYIFAGNAIFG